MSKLASKISKEDLAQSYTEHASSDITKPVNTTQFKKAIPLVNPYWFSVVQLPPK